MNIACKILISPRCMNYPSSQLCIIEDFIVPTNHHSSKKIISNKRKGKKWKNVFYNTKCRLGTIKLIPTSELAI